MFDQRSSTSIRGCFFSIEGQPIPANLLRIQLIMAGASKLTRKQEFATAQYVRKCNTIPPFQSTAIIATNGVTFEIAQTLPTTVKGTQAALNLVVLESL